MSSYPTAEEYCRWGLSAKGARHVYTLFGAPESTTTAAVCHTFIKTRTTPPGWQHRASPSNEGGRQRYRHEYINVATGQAQNFAPLKTCSLCELLATEPETAAITGRPTAFFSHAWKYSFRQLVEALEAFQATRPEGEPEAFFWIDVCSIDQHKVGGWPQEWWTTTFKEAIRLIGHTVMMLSPWDSPVPLTRAWCLWELHCTISVGAQFSVCLGPDEQTALEAALLDNPGALLAALADIDVAKAEAGSPSDRDMILQAVRDTAGGTSDLNARAMAQMRAWVKGVVMDMIAARRDRADGSLLLGRFDETRTLGAVLGQMGDVVEERRLQEALVAECMMRYGGVHHNTLLAKMDLTAVLKKMGQVKQARQLSEEAVAGFTELFDGGHPATLNAKFDLAKLLREMGDFEKARPLYFEVLAGRTKHVEGGQNEGWGTEIFDVKHSLANLEAEMGNVDSARQFYAEVVTSMTELLGGGHVQTLLTKYNLANLEMQAGNLDLARQIYEEILARQIEQLGNGHAHTLATKQSLTTVLKMMGKDSTRKVWQMKGEVAAGLVESASRVESGGYTVASVEKKKLGLTLLKQGELAEAHLVLEEAVAGCTEEHGGGDTHTLDAKMDLATVLKEMANELSVGRAIGVVTSPELQKAQQLLEEVVDGRAQQMGDGDVSTLAAKMNLSSVYKQLGNVGKARQLQKEVVAGRTEHYGSEHAETLEAKLNLANLLDEIGELVEARRVYEDVVAGETMLLGGNHVQTLKSKMCFASLLKKMGQSQQALQLNEEAVSGFLAVYGDEHCMTVSTKFNLANLHLEMGQLSEALSLYEEAVAGFTALLGPMHGNTQLAAKALAHCRQQLSLLSEALKAPNAVVVVLCGLVGAAQHNGKQASVLGFAVDRGRFTVRLHDDPSKEILVKPSNIEVVTVPVGQVVGVSGLVAAAEHNGKRGTVITELDAKTGRYTVQLQEGGKALGLKPANLRLVDGIEEEELAQALELSLQHQNAQPGPEPAGLGFLGLAWPTGALVDSLDAFLAGPPEANAGLPMYAVALAGLTPAQLVDDAALVEAGVTKLFHRRRICKWAAMLVARDDIRK
jgi:tetratricopeptide (TPR) repeat protein